MSEAKAKLPTYSVMVNTALESLDGGRKGSSRQAIEKYIKENYDVSDNYKLHLKNALKKAVESGAVISTTGAGTTGSFKLPKPETKKTAAKKEAKKPATKEADEKPKPAGKAAAKKMPIPKTTEAKKTVVKKAAPKKAAKNATPMKKAAASTKTKTRTKK